MYNKDNQSGFTLVETLMVILIIGLLASIAIPVFNGQRAKTKNQAAKASLVTALKAARSYYYSNGDSYEGIEANISNTESSIVPVSSAEFLAYLASEPGSDPKNKKTVIVRYQENNDCVYIANLSAGNKNYSIADCRKPLVRDYEGVKTLAIGTYYGWSNSNFYQTEASIWRDTSTDRKDTRQPWKE